VHTGVTQVLRVVLLADLYTGVMMSNKPPIRNNSDKWHVTIKEYPHSRYPNYMGGPGYVLAYQAVTKVIAASYKVPFMPMEDVFVGKILVINPSFVVAICSQINKISVVG